MRKEFTLGQKVKITRPKSRIWLDDDGDMTHLESGTTGVVQEQRGSLTVVHFDVDKWSKRPAKIKTEELELI